MRRLVSLLWRAPFGLVLAVLVLPSFLLGATGGLVAAALATGWQTAWTDFRRYLD